VKEPLHALGENIQRGEHASRKAGRHGQPDIGIVVVSSDFRVVGINKYAASILQINPADLGKKVYKYHPTRAHARIRHLLKRACNSANDIPHPVIMHVKGRVLAVNLCRIETGKSAPGYFYTMSFIDITGQEDTQGSGRYRLRSIPVYDGKTYLFIDIPSICMIKSEGNYCRIFTDSEQYYLRVTLNEIEKKYSGKIIIRVHRGYLVNIEKIKRIEKKKGKGYVIFFSDKSIPPVPVARRRFKELKETLGL